MDICSLRLHNQHLSTADFKTPRDVVSHFGAMQSQDYQMAKWAVGLRINNSTDAAIEKAFNEGLILRTHVMRPTWHFVLPEDIRWMQELTSHRVKKLMGHYNRKLELDDDLFKKTNSLIIKSLRSRQYLTRQELKTIFSGVGIQTDVQRLAHIIMWAELDGLICSGPRKGKPASLKTTSQGGQFTYALVDERVPKSQKLDHDEGLATLALKYFQSHGPAQLKDFAWWSGLTMTDAQNGIDLIRSKLLHEVIEGKEYWFVPTKFDNKTETSGAFLLSIYDEYTIAYTDRSALEGEGYKDRFLAMGNVLTAVMVLHGVVIGMWKRTIKKEVVYITLTPFRKLTVSEKNSIGKAAHQYGEFLGMRVVMDQSLL